MFRSVSEEEMKRRKAILIKNVEDGFREYSSVILKGDKNSMQSFLEKCLRENEKEAFADFYYPVLSPEHKEAFLKGLDEDGRKILSAFECSSGQVFYPLMEDNLSFLAEMTAKNWLFSSFFFTRYPAVVWGNYNLEYPLFCRDSVTLDFYKKIALECGLELLV